jgi:hypothetical protein
MRAEKKFVEQQQQNQDEEEEEEADESDEELSPQRRAHVSNVQRRPEADLRNEHLRSGAMLLSFSSKLPTANVPSHVLLAWRKIEKKGFRVTTTGCLVPHFLHSHLSRNMTAAARVSLRFFKGLVPDKSLPATNELGWPTRQEHSHLCHCKVCCNPDHVVLEAAWKTRKRNYCGRSGACDCGMEPPCLRVYRSVQATADELADATNLLTYSTENLAARLKAALPAVGRVTVLPANCYEAEDEKRKHRNKRLKGQRKTEKEAKKKTEGMKRKEALKQSLMPTLL